jgi:hypothetical protein
VYEEVSGEVWMSGKFIVEGRSRGASGSELKFSSADGRRIYLQNHKVLTPVAAEPPFPIPGTSKLAGNGVYVDCQPIGKEYKCHMFLAADGATVASGLYRCTVNEHCWESANPKLAAASRIDMAGGETLERR